jgi:hypothetical protein
MEESERKAIMEITTLAVRSSEFENDIASDDLKFSIWAATIATAGFGLVLLNADKIVEVSWLTRQVGWYFILSIQIMLAGSIICAGLVQYLIGLRLRSERQRINLLNAQLARVLSGQISNAGESLVDSILEGGYLRKDSRDLLISVEEATGRLDTYYALSLRVQIILTGLAYLSLLVIGLRPLL